MQRPAGSPTPESVESAVEPPAGDVLFRRNGGLTNRVHTPHTPITEQPSPASQLSVATAAPLDRRQRFSAGTAGNTKTRVALAVASNGSDDSGELSFAVTVRPSVHVRRPQGRGK
jgi:hypothetical protein